MTVHPARNLSLGCTMSPAVAIAWEIWRRRRSGILGVAGLVVLTSLMNLSLRHSTRWTELAEASGYVTLGIALLITCGIFEFTEGQRRGGFGSFPTRLFWMPLRTRWLVAWPLLYGTLGLLAVYLIGARLIFGPLGKSLPVIWPCLYIANAYILFQTTIWSIPDRRYLKLLGLSLVATGILFSWMFFLPHLIEGTLADWGYQGDPGLFLRMVALGLLLCGPLGYGISLVRIRQQRHGVSGRRAFDPWDRLRDAIHLRHKPFESAIGALFWHEWRQTGYILPIGTGVILLLTCLPSYLFQPLSASQTLGILYWLILTPLWLALVVGRGFAKPDFWKPNLTLSSFHATLPASAGTWVLIKGWVALGSVACTWGILIVASFLWIAHAADFGVLQEAWSGFKFRYAHSQRMPMLGLSLVGLILLSWRCMISALAVGLSGRKPLFYFANTLVTLSLVSVPILLIWRSDHEASPFRLHELWSLITALPAMLGALVVAKVSVGAWAWHRVFQLQLVSSRVIILWLVLWLLITGLMVVWALVAFPATAWLRHAAMLVALLVVPFAGPALAMMSLSANRSRQL